MLSSSHHMISLVNVATLYHEMYRFAEWSMNQSSFMANIAFTLLHILEVATLVLVEVQWFSSLVPDKRVCT
jgi:hypothetical protein